MADRGLSPKEIGSTGESLAADFLIGQGYEILARNLRLKMGEIDILARDGEVIAVIEVKTRKAGRFADPIEAVNPVKARKLWMLAVAVAARYPDTGVRIDVVTVSMAAGKARLRLVKDVA